MTAQWQSLITVTVDGKNLGTFDSRVGGITDAEIAKYRAGGGARQRARLGRGDHGDVTVARELHRERDHELARTLRASVGKATISIVEQLLDEDEVPWGKPVTFNGRLKSVDAGDADSNSDDERMFTIVATITEIS